MIRYRNFTAAWLLFWLLLGTAPLAAQEMSPSWRQIGGHPLTIYVTQDGRYELYPATAAPSTGSLHLRYADCTLTSPGWREELGATAGWRPIAQAPVQGHGLAVDPWRVVTSMSAACDTRPLQVQTVANYVEGDTFFHLSVNACGGVAGQDVAVGILTQSHGGRGHSLEGESTAVFDSQGCATFRMLWDYNAPPQAPLALEMFTSSATPGRDATATWGVPLIFASFVALTLAWLAVMRPKRVKSEK